MSYVAKGDALKKYLCPGCGAPAASAVQVTSAMLCRCATCTKGDDGWFWSRVGGNRPVQRSPDHVGRKAPKEAR